MNAYTPAGFDFKNPDYTEIFAVRAERLQRIRADKSGELLKHLRAYYRTDEGIPQFINDWGCTFDPRLAELNQPTIIPFVLFPKQWDWCAWALQMWRGQEKALTEKSRDCGISWLAMALSCSLCLFRDGMAIGFGSRKEEYVDKIGSPKSLFWKGREYLKLLPPEFRPGWSATDAPHMRISFPATGSVISGEAGDNIGRGDRTGIYFIDEAASIDRPQLIDQALAGTTNCRIDISTPRGMANPFAQKRHSWPPHKIFIFDWRDDPRKDDAWYRKQRDELDAVALAQEVDRDYSASVQGRLIPMAWVQSAIDLHLKLGIEPSGARRGALDVADEGPDLNAFCAARGILIENVTAWSGKGDDIAYTTARAFTFCDVLGLEGFDYDADGMGVGVRGDARVLNEQRTRKLDVQPFRGSGEVVDKDKPIETAAPRTLRPDPQRIERLNGDYFLNAKAQAWFSLRLRFQRAHRALEMHLAGEDWRAAYAADDLISINSKMPELAKVTTELAQPTYSQTTAGKMIIDKAPKRQGEPATKSPNHGDAIMIRFAPRPARRRYNLAALAD